MSKNNLCECGSTLVLDSELEIVDTYDNKKCSNEYNIIIEMELGVFLLRLFIISKCKSYLKINLNARG